MRTSAFRCMMLALGCALAAAPAAALAQESAAGAPGPGENAVLGSALMFDPAALAGTAPAKPLRLPGLSNPKDLDVSRSGKPDGFSTVGVIQPLPTDWDAKVGADLGLAATAPDGDRPGKLPPAAATPTPPLVWGNEKAVKFEILPTGTTFGAGISSISTNPVTHNTLSADQKLYGPLHVTTAVTDIGQPTRDKRITAGFKLNW